jgi:hypothetical protein
MRYGPKFRVRKVKRLGSANPIDGTGKTVTANYGGFRQINVQLSMLEA